MTNQAWKKGVEYRIVINYMGNITVFRDYPDGRTRLWAYTKSITDAIKKYNDMPITIVAEH